MGRNHVPCRCCSFSPEWRISGNSLLDFELALYPSPLPPNYQGASGECLTLSLLIFTYQRSYITPRSGGESALRRMKLSGVFVGEELIVTAIATFQSLDIVRLHGAPKLLDQGMAPVPQFARIRFSHPAS